jgi:hypothetical protein
MPPAEIGQTVATLFAPAGNRGAQARTCTAPTNDEKRKQREGRHHGADAPLDGLGNFG